MIMKRETDSSQDFRICSYNYNTTLLIKLKRVDKTTYLT